MLYRMIKKHIAGTTMSSALVKAEELNSKKIPASITFLSDTVDNKSKARYITITYMELIRRIARLGLKASVHIPAEQSGLLIDADTALKNLSEIITTGNRYGVFVWIELHDPKSTLIASMNGTKGYGWAFSEHEAKKFLAGHSKPHSAKLLFNEHAESKQSMKALAPLLKGMANVVLASPPDSILKGLSSSGKMKNSVAVEFKLGYSPKKLIKAAKSAKVSVSIPFGKDWTQFAMNSVPESYMRFLAGSLLNEKHATESA